jgi:transglutaminase-like putative cysteine protease
MQYLVRHLTRFVYTAPVAESVMEIRMQPLELDRQRCLRFNVTTTQRARLFAYRDHFGNAVHYFDIPGHHAKLDISVESAVEVAAAPDLPKALPMEAWNEVDALANSPDHTDWLLPSPFTEPTDALQQFARAIGFGRVADPLTTVRELNTTIYSQFSYEPSTTHVDSPIDDALRARAGVCQDFSHITTALLRTVGIPCRYVSGYIAPRESHQDRAGDNATHAWVEAFIPRIGWVGCDPTNNTIVSQRHIAVAIGRDYSDVPPTRGVFKGDAGSELSVAVAVTPAKSNIPVRELAPSVSWIVPARAAVAQEEEIQRQHQQQQQQ